MNESTTLWDGNGGGGCERCPTCHQPWPKPWAHRMDLSKVNLLIDIARCRAREPGWVKVQVDPKTKHNTKGVRVILSDHVHALRLKWFGLIETSEKRSGLYRVLPKGLDFLAGRVSVPERIYVRDAKVVSEDRTQKFVNDVRGVALDCAYWDRYRMSPPGDP